ncbi:MAG: mannose-6-phosphate isomerase, class I [Aquihabitans sp.]
MLLLRNSVLPYAWGRTNGLAAIVGSPPSGGPEAELWVGTHPAAPSLVVDDPEGRTLAQVIASDPARWLGPELADKGLTSLPFLLKILAVGSPLSLQAHPSDDQAQSGFARETAAGLPLTAPNRTYRDASAKPEALVALTDTWAICGFREPEASARLIRALGSDALRPLADALAPGGPEALHDALAWVLHLEGQRRAVVADALAVVVNLPLIEEAAISDEDRKALDWVRQLVETYPGDPTAVAPLLLHVLELKPGDAVHLPAGNLHAYLEGAGVEVMAASDNVLRGGLTPKHIDVDELLAILHYEPGVPPPPERRTVADGVVVYDSGEDAFALAVVRPEDETVEIEPSAVSLLLAVSGQVTVSGRKDTFVLDGGSAAFVPPGAGPLLVSGPGELWWATMGNGLPQPR